MRTEYIICFFGLCFWTLHAVSTFHLINAHGFYKSKYSTISLQVQVFNDLELLLTKSNETNSMILKVQNAIDLLSLKQISLERKLEVLETKIGLITTKTTSMERLTYETLKTTTDTNGILSQMSKRMKSGTLCGQCAPSDSKTYAHYSNGVSLIGGARQISCSGCSRNVSCGWIGFQGKLHFGNISSDTNSNCWIQVSYTNGDPHPRYLSVDINDVFHGNLTCPPTGSFQSTKKLEFQGRLKAGHGNSILFYNANAYAPDIDFIKIECSYC